MENKFYHYLRQYFRGNEFMQACIRYVDKKKEYPID